MSFRSIARLAANLALSLGLCTLAHEAPATVITYDVANVSGSSWRQDDSLTDDTLGSAPVGFSVYFDLGLFENLRSLCAPVAWDGFIAQPDPLLPDNGFIDLWGLHGGFAVDQTLGGFSVKLDWLGAGMRGSQLFDIINATDLSFIDSGATTRAVVTRPTTGGAPVPEPSPHTLRFNV